MTTFPTHRTRATAEISVLSSEANAYDVSSRSTLKEVRIKETFKGEIDGESEVRALQIMNGDGTATMVSVQRFRGTLRGRSGTFVLQGTETVSNGKIEAKWFVVPGSGTDSLSRLRGEGGFSGEFGKGSKGFLEYWFE